MCTVVIVDPYSLDIVRTVFHGSLSIGELKFMAAIPSGKGAGLVYKVLGSDDTFKFELPCEIPAVCNPLNANISIIFRQMNKFILRIESLCPWKVGPTIEWKMLGEGGFLGDWIDSSSSVSITESLKCNSFIAPTDVKAQIISLVNLRYNWKLYKGILVSFHAKKFPPELRSGLHGIRAFSMVLVNGLVNMHGWQLVMQLDIFSVTIQVYDLQRIFMPIESSTSNGKMLGEYGFLGDWIDSSSSVSIAESSKYNSSIAPSDAEA
ncbi:hypothetical protein IFM89_025474 [Coptis chinensis]|uniref:Uncharacterized protein n=1 Tax=Coptis chinensis TaxID=261450 RepID=A0A835HMH3_9MAGN|nr:hypothetical protein IFM89_025474 [Coptis chinensis]